MSWYNYIFCFLSGALFANALPHWVRGISGDRFPTPFAKPSGRGLSSALTNVLWGLFNLLLGVVLLKVIFNSGGRCDVLSFGIFFAGLALMSIFSSVHFETKDKE